MMMAKKNKPLETLVSTSPVFIKVSDTPFAASIPEICEAAEEKIGHGRIAGAVKKGGLFRLHGKSPEDKIKLLEGIHPHIVITRDNENKMKSYDIPLYAKNPISNDIGEDGKIIPSTRLTIDGFLLSVSMEDVKKTLEKIPGLVMKSPIFFDRAWSKDKTLSRFVNGKRFVFINEPSENAPLPPTIRVGAFQASLYYKGMPLRCWDCFGPHRRGDKTCPKNKNSLHSKHFTGVEGDNNMDTRKNVWKVPVAKQPEATMEVERQHEKEVRSTDTEKTVQDLLRDLRRSPGIKFSDNPSQGSRTVVGSGNQSITIDSQQGDGMGESKGAMNGSGYTRGDEQSSLASALADEFSICSVSDRDNDEGHLGTVGLNSELGDNQNDASDNNESDIESNEDESDRDDDTGSSDVTVEAESSDTGTGSDNSVISKASTSEHEDNDYFTTSVESLGEDQNKSVNSDETELGQGSDLSHKDMSSNTPKTSLIHTESVDGGKNEMQEPPNNGTRILVDSQKLLDQTDRLKDRLMPDSGHEVRKTSLETTGSHGGDFMTDRPLRSHESSGNEAGEKGGLITKGKRFRKRRSRKKTASQTNTKNGSNQPSITDHFMCNVDRKRSFKSTLSTSSSEDSEGHSKTGEASSLSGKKGEGSSES